jgi:hypothetical protein
MSSLSNIPLWAVALVLAAAAPWCVSVLQSVLEERRRERTRKLLRNLGLPVDERGGAQVRAHTRSSKQDARSDVSQAGQGRDEDT